MLVLTTDSPAATFDLGRKLALYLAKGDVICLSGDLGAGEPPCLYRASPPALELPLG